MFMTTFEGLDFQGLEPQDVREYWEDEARQFTPWLANGIQSEEPSYLEAVLELDFEVIERETRRQVQCRYFGSR